MRQRKKIISSLFSTLAHFSLTFAVFMPTSIQRLSVYVHLLFFSFFCGDYASGVMMRGFRFVIQAAASIKEMERKEKGLKEDFGWALEWSGSWAVASRKIFFWDIYC